MRKLGALAYKKSIEEQLKNAENYKKTPSDKAAYDLFTERKEYLQAHRRNSGVEELWAAADKAYIPHNLSSKGKGKKVLVSDDELGWRSAPVDLQAEDNWQEDSVPPNPYIMIQTALGIIVDRNPAAVLTAGAKKYERNNVLMENLYERSWDIAHSKQAALKPFVFNCAKYGLGVGRTYPLTIKQQVEDLVEYNAEDPKKNKYEQSEYTYYDDVFRESMSPWQVWFDDSTIVGNPFSMRDVVFYKDYEWKDLVDAFGHLYNFSYIKPQKKVLTKEGKLEVHESGAHEGLEAKMQERVWFWESMRLDMLFIVTEDGVCLVNEPMPQSPKNKRLSVWYAPWTLRNDKSPFGIGVYEAMRNDHKLHMKIRNMTMDQLVLSIYREFFYSGTDTLEGDGIMRVRPGRGRQVSDPKNIKWNEVPGPGKDAWEGLAYQEKKMEDATAISKNLQGEVTGSTAFEISQARESSLKRLKTPLENITDGLEKDAYISLGIIEDLYSVPKIKLIANDKYIEPFEMEQYEREDGGEMVEGDDYQYEYKEVPLDLERGTDGNVVKSKTNKFFTMKAEDFPWEGVVKITGQSIVANSEILDRVTTVEMGNLIVPLFQMPREIAEKPVREIIKAYHKDPEDWMPDAWLIPPVAPAGPSLFVDPAQAEAEAAAGGSGAPAQTGMETVTGTGNGSAAAGASQIATQLGGILK